MRPTRLAPDARPWAVRLDRGTTILLLTACLLTLLIAVAVGAYAGMVDDDVVRAARPRQIGWWAYVYGFTYFKWQGRWASCGLESFVLPRVELTRYYWTLIAAVGAIDLAGLFVVMRYGVGLPARRAVGATAVAGAFLWAGLPSAAEAVYWFVGAVENAMCLSLAAMVVVAVARLKPTALNGSILAVAGFVVCGFHELYGAMFCAALAAATGAAFYARSDRRWVWLAVTAAAAVGLAVVVLAPGNAHRARTDGARHGRQLFYDLRVCFSQLKYWPRIWLGDDPKLIFATVLVACSAAGTSLKSTLARFPWKGVIPLIWLIAVGVGFFGPSWAFGGRMPERTLTGNWVVFASGWLATVFVWTRDGRWKTPAVARAGTWAGRAGLAAAVLLTGNAVVARRDFRRPLMPWHAAVDARYAALRSGLGSAAVVPPLPSPPRLLRTGELYESDPGIYYASWSFYFGLQTVRVDPPVKAPADYRVVRTVGISTRDH